MQINELKTLPVGTKVKLFMGMDPTVPNPAGYETGTVIANDEMKTEITWDKSELTSLIYIQDDAWEDFVMDISLYEAGK